MIHDVAGFLRWRLKPNRWAAKGLYTLADLPRRIGAGEPASAPHGEWLAEMEREAVVRLPLRLDTPAIDLAPYAGKARNTAFIDIGDDHFEALTDTLVTLLADPDVASLVHGYFDGRPWLWNCALDFSEPSDRVGDSQLWHFDYGDVRQLHLLVYYTDVTPDAGPFTYLPLHQSQKVRRHPLVIERMTDEDLAERYGIDAAAETVRLTGQRGEVFANDPGRLMHQGARCRTNRLVQFITFTSPAPMSKGGKATISAETRARLGAAYAARVPGGLLSPATFA